MRPPPRGCHPRSTHPAHMQLRCSRCMPIPTSPLWTGICMHCCCCWLVPNAWCTQFDFNRLHPFKSAWRCHVELHATNHAHAMSCVHACLLIHNSYVVRGQIWFCSALILNCIYRALLYALAPIQFVLRACNLCNSDGVITIGLPQHGNTYQPTWHLNVPCLQLCFVYPLSMPYVEVDARSAGSG